MDWWWWHCKDLGPETFIHAARLLSRGRCLRLMKTNKRSHMLCLVPGTYEEATSHSDFFHTADATGFYDYILRRHFIYARYQVSCVYSFLPTVIQVTYSSSQYHFKMAAFPYENFTIIDHQLRGPFWVPTDPLLDSMVDLVMYRIWFCCRCWMANFLSIEMCMGEYSGCGHLRCPGCRVGQLPQKISNAYNLILSVT